MELHTSTNTFGGDASTRKCRQKVGFKKALENLRDVKYWLKVEEPVLRIPSTPLVPILPPKPVRTSP